MLWTSFCWSAVRQSFLDFRQHWHILSMAVSWRCFTFIISTGTWLVLHSSLTLWPLHSTSALHWKTNKKIPLHWNSQVPFVAVGQTVRTQGFPSRGGAINQVDTLWDTPLGKGKVLTTGRTCTLQALQGTLAMVCGIGESNKNFRWRLSAFLPCALLSHEAEHSSHPTASSALTQHAGTTFWLLMCPRDTSWWSNNLPQEKQKSACPAQQRRAPFFRGFRLLAGRGPVVSTQDGKQLLKCSCFTALSHYC